VESENVPFMSSCPSYIYIQVKIVFTVLLMGKMRLPLTVICCTRVPFKTGLTTLCIPYIVLRMLKNCSWSWRCWLSKIVKELIGVHIKYHLCLCGDGVMVNMLISKLQDHRLDPRSCQTKLCNRYFLLLMKAGCIEEKEKRPIKEEYMGNVLDRSNTSTNGPLFQIARTKLIYFKVLTSSQSH
jgi:hypothetical protein